MQSSNRLPTRWNPLRLPTYVESMTSPHALRIDDLNGDGTFMYLGEAKVGAQDTDPVWQIRQVVKSGTVTSFTYANGNSDFVNKWSDRASLTYT